MLSITNVYKYLGFIADKRISSQKHFKERCAKMKAEADLFVSVILQMRGVSMEKKKIMAKACVNSVILYATEALSSKALSEKIMEKAEIVQRRVLRRLLRASHTVANETLLFDLGLLSIKGEMDKRLLDFRYKMQDSTNTFIKSIFNINRKCKLGWEQRCQDSMAFYNMEPNMEMIEDSRCRLKKIKDMECMHRLRRLEVEVPKKQLFTGRSPRP